MNSIQFISKPLAWFMAVLLAAFVAGCGGSSTTETTPLSSDKAFTSFTVGGNVGVINQSAKTIALTVPSGTPVTNLVPTFTITGGVVKIGVVTQVSATTANNFTAPKVYVVTAADGSTASYTVTVTVASSTAKAISAFSLAWTTGTPGTATGTISGASSPYAIALTVPNGTNVTALKATFATTGASVTVGTPAVTQVSGVGGTANNFSGMVPYTVHAADGSTAIYNVTVTVAAASDKAISSFSLAWTTGTPGSATGTISGASSPYAIALTVPSGTNVTALVATFVTTGASVTVGAPAVTQVSGTGGTANDFTGMVAYTVHAADASTAIYNVTVAATALPNPTAPTLGEAGRFVILAPAAITTTGITAISNGDIGISPAARSLMTGFVANGSTGAVNELTNGTTYAADDANPAPYPYPLHFSTPVVGAPWTTTAAMLTQANTDLGIADTFLAADPNPGVNVVTQVCPTQLGTLTLTRGVYKTASNVGITTGSLTLDAQGDPNSVFIFNIGGTLSTGAPGGSIVLINGALAKNVYWRTAGITTIGAGTIFKGLVFANTQVNVLSGANITGSLYAVTDRVTLIADTVTKAP